MTDVSEKMSDEELQIVRGIIKDHIVKILKCETIEELEALPDIDDDPRVKRYNRYTEYLKKQNEKKIEEYPEKSIEEREKEGEIFVNVYQRTGSIAAGMFDAMGITNENYPDAGIEYNSLFPYLPRPSLMKMLPEIPKEGE